MTHQPKKSSYLLTLLEEDKQGVPKNTLDNCDIVSQNDPFLKSLGFCTRGMYFVEKPETYHITDGPIPEMDPEKISTNGLRHYLKSKYRFGAFSGDRRYFILDNIAEERAFDPVADYLNRLEWDGIPRLTTALPGSEGTAYDYELARKVFVISAKRVLEPGRHLHRLPVFHSDNEDSMRRWISLVGCGYTKYFSYYGKRVVKDASRSWIAVFDLSKYRTFKGIIDFWGFANAREDISRERYREWLDRNWDVWAITSRPKLLEQDYSRGRRFSIELPAKIDFDKYTQEYIDQVWAEAVHEVRNGYDDLLYIEDLKNPGGKLGYL